MMKNEIVNTPILGLDDDFLNLIHDLGEPNLNCDVVGLPPFPDNFHSINRSQSLNPEACFVNSTSGSTLPSDSTSPSSPDSERSTSESNVRFAYTSGSDCNDIMSPPPLYDPYFNMSRPPIMLPTTAALQQAHAALMAATTASVYTNNVPRVSSVSDRASVQNNKFAKVPINRLMPSLAAFPAGTGAEAPCIPDSKKRTKPHNVIERRYRDKLSGQLTSLRDAIPACRSHSKVNKATIMKLAADYIAELEERLRQNEVRTNHYQFLLESHGLFHLVNDKVSSPVHGSGCPTAHTLSPSQPPSPNLNGSTPSQIHQPTQLREISTPMRKESNLPIQQAQKGNELPNLIIKNMKLALPNTAEQVLAHPPLPTATSIAPSPEASMMEERPNKRQRMGTSIKLSMAMFCVMLIFNPLTQWMSVSGNVSGTMSLPQSDPTTTTRVLHSLKLADVGSSYTASDGIDGSSAHQDVYGMVYTYTAVYLQIVWLMIRMFAGLVVFVHMLSAEHKTDVSDTDLVHASTYVKMADAALDNGEHRQAFILSREGLATLSRELSRTPTQIVLTLLWQCIRQLSHILRFGQWIEGICANRSEASRSVCILLAQLYSTLATSAIMLTTGKHATSEGDIALGKLEMLLISLMSLNSTQAGLNVFGSYTTTEITYAYDRCAIVLLGLAENSRVAMLVAGWWAKKLALACLEQGTKSKSYVKYILSPQAQDDLKNHYSATGNLTLRYNDPISLLRYGHRKIALLNTFKTIQKGQGCDIVTKGHDRYRSISKVFADIYDECVETDDCVTARLSLLGMAACSVFSSLNEPEGTVVDTYELSEVRELVVDLQAAEIVDGELRSGGERALFCAIVAYMSENEGRVSLAVDALSHATTELGNEDCASSELASVLVCVAAELTMEVRFSMWAKKSGNKQFSELSRTSQLNLWSLSRVAAVYKTGASVQARLQAKFQSLGKSNIVRTRLLARRAEKSTKVVS
eukprot:CFRG1172T1